MTKKAKKTSKKSSKVKPRRKILKKSAAKRKITKKKKASAKKVTPKITENMVLAGEIVHYFPHVKAGVINLKEGTLAVGDTIFIKGHTTKFKQKVASLQINRVDVHEIKKGDDAGLLVKSRVRIGDLVYKI